MYPTQARAMALEAGHLMHQVFAGVRIWQLLKTQDLPDHADVVATRIFGHDRWDNAFMQSDSYADETEQLNALCSAILDTADWLDDPNERNRNMHAFSLCSYKYVNEVLPYMEDYPIYVEDRKDPNCQVGIEQVFDVVLTYTDSHQIRYVGTIDGLVQAVRVKDKPWMLEDNKTSVRLDTAWRDSFNMSHQVTGYCASSTAVFGFPVWRNRIVGSKIRPTGGADDFLAFNPLERTGDMIQSWAAWMYDTERTYTRYENDFENAPTYTHSCNRYFRTCALMPFCTDTADGRRETYDEHMVPVEMSPSELASRD